MITGDGLRPEARRYERLLRGQDERIAELERQLAAARALLNEMLGESGRGTITIHDIAYTVFMRGRIGENMDDGGPCDWFADTRPIVEKQIALWRARAASAQTGGEP